MWLTCSTLQLPEGLVHDDQNIWIPPHSIHYREEGNNSETENFEAFENNLISAFLLFIVHP